MIPLTFLSGPALSLVTKYWKVGIFAVLVGIIGYQNYSSIRWLLGLNTIPNIEEKLMETKEQYDQLKSQFDEVVAANQRLAEAQNRLNNQISQWKATSQQLERQNAKLSQQLSTFRKQTNSQATAILQGKTPKTCEEAFEFLEQSRGELKW